MKQGKQGVYARYIKRILDVLLSGCALIVLSPVVLIVAVLDKAGQSRHFLSGTPRQGREDLQNV